MIYITGDVHSRIEGNWEQGELESELDNSIKYLKVLKKHRLSCTLFVNGVLLKKSRKFLVMMLKWAGIPMITLENLG